MAREVQKEMKANETREKLKTALQMDSLVTPNELLTTPDEKKLIKI